MGRIKGHYEWDDDDLTPGQKKEGGLHQNLFDDEGKLRGSARFVPDHGDSEPLVITETVYVPIEERRRSREQEELEEAIAAAVAHLIDRGIARAKPVVTQWYKERVRPRIHARRSRLNELRSRRTPQAATTVTEDSVVEPMQALALAGDLPIMSKAEAQARYLAALAARAYADEQIRLVADAHIVDAHGDGVAELECSLAELPPADVEELLESMVANPSMLREETLAELASLLGRRVGPDQSGPRELR